MTNKRQLRVSALLKSHLSSILSSLTQTSSLARYRITITEVRISADLRKALVLVMPGFQKEGISAPETQQLIRHLKELTPQIQKRLAPLITFKSVPFLKFSLDESIDQQQKIHDLFRNILDNHEE